MVRIDSVTDAPVELRMTVEALLAEPLAYIDRHGVYRAPFGTAEKVARAVCQAHAQRVLAEIARERDTHHKVLLTGRTKSQERAIRTKSPEPPSNSGSQNKHRRRTW